MKEVIYRPKAELGFDGTIIIVLPTFDERYKYMEDCGFAMNDKGEMEAGIKQLSAIRKMVGFSKPHYKEVALKHLESGIEYKSFDDLTMSSDCDSILIEVSTQILNGFKVSKN